MLREQVYFTWIVLPPEATGKLDLRPMRGD